MNNNTTDAILRRRVRDWGERPAVFLPLSHWRDMPLSKPLMRISETVAQLIYTGGWDAAHTPPRDWWLEPLQHGYRIERRTTDPAQARYIGPGWHRDVRMSASWYGAEQDHQAMQLAHSRLAGLLRGTFDKDAQLMGTPGRTGLDLLERSLPKETDYLPIPLDLDAAIRHGIGQGRMEFCAPDELRHTDELISLDARWMYAACIRDLPRGPVHHYRDTGEAKAKGFLPYVPGFYRILFRVPEPWPFVGLLSAWDAERERAYWPTHNKGGDACWYETTVAEPELRLAVKEGYSVRIRESWLFEQGKPIAEPGRTWIDKLTSLRGFVDAQPGDPLVSAAIRNIVIQTVGQWHRTSRHELHDTPAAMRHTIPATALDVTPFPNLKHVERWEWHSPAALHRDQLPYMHPEWSAYVWSRSRYRVAQAALDYQRSGAGHIAAFRNDALVVTGDPHWPDNEKIGTFREKRRWIRGIELPDGSTWDGAVPRDELHYRQLLSVEDVANGE